MATKKEIEVLRTAAAVGIQPTKDDPRLADIQTLWQVGYLQTTGVVAGELPRFTVTSDGIALIGKWERDEASEIKASAKVEILAAALREIMKDAPAELPAQEDMPPVRGEAFIDQVVDTCAYFVAEIAREALAKAGLEDSK